MTSGSPRAVALSALLRVETGAYANLVLPGLLSRSAMTERDRALVTELVYGTTRMRRACDWLVDRHLEGSVETPVRAALRMGAYQVAFMGTPAHAAVAETVEVAPRRAQRLVNAVLRKVASGGEPVWPDEATRLSYPDWIFEQLIADLGRDRALEALGHMNEPARVSARADGYVQDMGSRWVAQLVEVGEGHTVADLCAAPGGKATAMARAEGGNPSLVVAGDLRRSRVKMIAANAGRLGLSNLAPTVADAKVMPLRRAVFDRVLVDAPCTGLGVLRRRPDARWRVKPEDAQRLGSLQSELLDSASSLVRPGGMLVYCVCTMTSAETLCVDSRLAWRHPDLEPLPPPGRPWAPHGRGGLLLPQEAGTDGLFVLRVSRPSG